jgi:hypothetical protein
MNVSLDYTNYRNVRSIRKINISHCFFGERKQHISACPMIQATDVDRDVLRCFDIRNIHEIAVGNANTSAPLFLFAAQRNITGETIYFPVRSENESVAREFMQKLITLNPDNDNDGNEDDEPLNVSIVDIYKKI